MDEIVSFENNRHMMPNNTKNFITITDIIFILYKYNIKSSDKLTGERG